MGTFIFSDKLLHLKIYYCCCQVNFSTLIKYEQKNVLKKSEHLTLTYNI